MFNFTTTTLIHSRDQFEANPNETNQVFRVNGVNLFKKDNVVAIYRSRYVDPVNGKLEVVVPTDGEKSDRYRLKFYLRRSGDNNSYYSNDFVFKGKEFVYEWTGKQNTAEKVAKLIHKIQRLYGDIYLKVYVDDKSGKLVFESDNYGLFTTASLEKWVETEPDCCVYREPGHWEAIDEITEEDLATKEGVKNCSTTTDEEIYLLTVESEGKQLKITKCINGFGTYWQIMKDLRLPTMENSRPWNIVATQQEMPIPGNKYVQYTLHYVTCRGILGGSAVGEVTHSKTTHVFFVPADCCCEGLDSEFQAALKEAFGDDIIEEAPHDDPVQQPYLQDTIDMKAESATYTAKETSDENSEGGAGGNSTGGNSEPTNGGGTTEPTEPGDPADHSDNPTEPEPENP